MRSCVNTPSTTGIRQRNPRSVYVPEGVLLTSLYDRSVAILKYMHGCVGTID